MGCAASTQATTIEVGPPPPGKVSASNTAVKSNGTTATTGSTTSAATSSKELTNNNNATTTPKIPPPPGGLQRPIVSETPSLANMSRDDWKVRPGYSSGASSYAGSESDDTDDESRSGEMEPVVSNRSTVSKHSDILALSLLREEMVADGDITKAVVRIETPFDTPIEEIYSGVLDGPVLGSGVSGIVRLVVHKATGIKYAVKCLDLGLIDTTEGLRQLRNEIFIMCQLDHPNIVRIEEVYESANEIYIVQELCLGGDLFDRLDEQPDYHYTEAQCARLVKQMLSAVRYLHSKGIIHRDLKLENFLFSSTDPNSELRMIDFGLSKHFEIGQSHCEKVGTPYTVAPEIIQGSYNEKSDVWALGVITYLLLCGETPFGGLDGESLLLVKENIMRAQLSFEPADIWENISNDAKNFVKTLLNPDPTKRPTAKDTQRDKWIQVWAKKDATEGTCLSKNTVGALMKFKESSDMQKLLSEVLSFTLLPEQLVELRSEFEKMDTDGAGEISLSALKRVLLQNAEAGALGALTEKEVEDIFDSIKVRKSDPTIRWHEFLAAGLSQARVDDRNLRLAFDRLDGQRKGYLTFDDLTQVLGSSTENDALEKIWLDSLKECKSNLQHITFDDFKKIMKGQPKEAHPQVCPLSPGGPLASVPEGKNVSDIPADALAALSAPSGFLDGSIDNPREFYGKVRSHSYEQKLPKWDEGSGGEFKSESFAAESMRSSLAVVLPTHSEQEFESIKGDKKMTPLMNNRAIYRKHREMRLAVLEASKQFDKKRNAYHSSQQLHTRASLIMKRGVLPPAEVEDAHTRALFEEAARRCGRERKARNKTVSDVSMLLKKKIAA